MIISEISAKIMYKNKVKEKKLRTSLLQWLYLQKEQKLQIRIYLSMGESKIDNNMKKKVKE